MTFTSTIFKGLSVATLLSLGAIGAYAQGTMNKAAILPAAQVASFLPEINVMWGLDQKIQPTSDDIYVILNHDGEETNVPYSNFRFSWVEEEPEGGGAGFQNETEGTNPSTKADGEYNILKIDLMDYTWLKYGTFELTIPEGIVVNQDGLVNPEQSVTYYLYKSYSTPPTWVPEPNSDIEEGYAIITASWEGASDIQPVNLSSRIIIDISKDADEEDERTFLSWDDNINTTDDGIQLDVNFLPEGFYYITIPEAFITFKDALGDTCINLDSGYSFYIVEGGQGPSTSIKGLEANKEGNFEIYDAKGISHGKTSDASSLRSLQPGLYIVNGQKIIVK